MNMIDLGGRVAVVTGASGGLGQEFAKRMRASGAEVALWDIHRHAAGAGEGRVDPYFQVDVTDEVSVRAAALATVERFGRIDILINNAGILGAQGPIESFDLNIWRRVIDVNLTGTFIVSKEIIGHMRAGGYGRIVNISSIAGKEGLPGSGAYGASKAAVMWLTKLFGRELALDNIRVNCISPASVDTGEHGMAVEVGPELLKQMASRIPMQRLAQASEVAALVAWLCSEECSFSTGATFDLSGGRAFF